MLPVRQPGLPYFRITMQTSPITTTRRAGGQVSQPRQGRAVATRERLLDVAGQLLGEVGVERISTNLICARAGMTPPA